MSDKIEKKIDTLTEDTPIVGQKWTCVSFMSPEGIRGCKVRALKIRGSFETQEEANKHADEIRRSDPDFDVFVGECGKWLGWDPDPNTIADHQYMEGQMQKLHDGYKENKKNAKKEEEKRRTDMREKGIDEERKSHNTERGRKQNVRDRLNKKLKQKNERIMDDEIVRETKSDIQTTDKIQKAEKIAKDERKILEQNVEKLNDGTKNIDSIDDDLETIEKEYNALIKKREHLEAQKKSENVSSVDA